MQVGGGAEISKRLANVGRAEICGGRWFIRSKSFLSEYESSRFPVTVDSKVRKTSHSRAAEAQPSSDHAAAENFVGDAAGRRSAHTRGRWSRPRSRRTGPTDRPRSGTRRTRRAGRRSSRIGAATPRCARLTLLARHSRLTSTGQLGLCIGVRTQGGQERAQERREGPDPPPCAGRRQDFRRYVRPGRQGDGRRASGHRCGHGPRRSESWLCFLDRGQARAGWRSVDRVAGCASASSGTRTGADRRWSYLRAPSGAGRAALGAAPGRSHGEQGQLVAPASSASRATASSQLAVSTC